MPAAQKEQCRDAGDGDHVGVFRHEERRELHAAVLRVKARDELILGFGKVEWNPIGFRKTGGQKNKEADNLGEGHLEDVPAREEAEIVTCMAIDQLAKTQN